MVIDYSQTINCFTALDAYPLPRIDQQVHELAKCKWFSTLDLKSAYYQVPLTTKTECIQPSKLMESCISIAAYPSVSPMMSRVSRELSIALSLITT